MVKITEELVRKKSEHNELVISTLEELSLHQEDIEKIEYLQNWCRNLKILLLQSNLISKIENLFKLKKLEYLNLALNIIERIENLEALESLNKLDLTLNFIGELSSVRTLRANYNLRNLILTGNPCTDFNGYRAYVITVLPQLQILDGIEIKPSDRIKASKDYEISYNSILHEEISYKMKRDDQKMRVAQQKLCLEEELKGCDAEERVKRFWNSKSEHCPETRIEMVKYRSESQEPQKKEEQPLKKTLNYFSPEGRPYNMNQPKLDFKLNDEAGYYELQLAVYKFLDTSQIDVDIQPKYIRVTVKGKVFQMELNEEVVPSTASCKRSQTTGSLLITMPKFCPENIAAIHKPNASCKVDNRKSSSCVDYKNICGSNTSCENVPELI